MRHHPCRARNLDVRLSPLLFRIGPMDPPAYILAIGVILAAAAPASYLAARRAATIDPVAMLKAE